MLPTLSMIIPSLLWPLDVLRPSLIGHLADSIPSFDKTQVASAQLMRSPTELTRVQGGSTYLFILFVVLRPWALHCIDAPSHVKSRQVGCISRGILCDARGVHFARRLSKFNPRSVMGTKKKGRDKPKGTHMNSSVSQSRSVGLEQSSSKTHATGASS
jgi:hypothetical protein